MTNNGTRFETDSIKDIMIFRNYLGGDSLLRFIPFAIFIVLALLVTIFAFKIEKKDFLIYMAVTSIFVLPVFILGIAVGFGHSKIILAPHLNSVERQYILFIPFWTTQFRLDDFNSLQISVLNSRRDEKTVQFFMIELKSRETGQYIKLNQSRDHDVARRVCEQAANFLHIPIEDEIRREPVIGKFLGLKNRTVQDNGSRKEKDALPPKPIKMKSTINRTGSTAIIDIPGTAHFWVKVFGTPLSVGFFLWAFFQGDCTGLIIDIAGIKAKHQLAIIACATVFVFFVNYFSLKILRRPYSQITASAKELVIKTGTGMDEKTVRIPADAVGRIEISSPLTRKLSSGRQVLLVRTPGVPVEFGAGLPPAEITYIQAVIHEAMFPRQEETKSGPLKKEKNMGRIIAKSSQKK